jgi:hypothetical protein
MFESKAHAGEAVKTLGQIVAIAALVLLYSMVAHKLYTDISVLAQKHSGEGFWRALGRYFIANLAGG